MKNVIYIKNLEAVWLETAKYLEKNHGWKMVMWVGTHNAFWEQIETLFPEALFYHHEAALRGLTPEYNSEISDGLQNLDESILEKISEYEAVFYEMMNRWCLDSQNITYENRRYYFLRMVGLWIAIIQDLDVEIIVCPRVPHRVYDYAAYIAAQILGVKYCMGNTTTEIEVREDGRRLARFFSSTNLKDRTKFIDKHKDIEDKSNVSAAIERYFELRQKAHKDAIPQYVANPQYVAKNNEVLGAHMSLILRFKKSLPLLVQIFSQYIKALIFRDQDKVFRLDFSAQIEKSELHPRLATLPNHKLRHFRVAWNVSKALKWYKAHSTVPDLTQKYVYFAPHAQPERTTTPDAEYYQHVELVVETLIAALPQGWKLYIKDHPSNYRQPYRVNNIRSVCFYERLQRLSDSIVFVPLSYDPFALMDSAQAVATATGTSGWEAIVRGKTTLVFGVAWYVDLQGCQKITSVQQCKEVLMNPDLYRSERSEILEFLQAFHTHGYDLDLIVNKPVTQLKKENPIVFQQYIEKLGQSIVEAE